MDFYGFYTGKEFEAYQFLGAHISGNGVVFRTFAPNASGIVVIGEFNRWQGSEMHRIYDGNFWECYIEGAKEGQMYKYRIYQRDGSCKDHSDPYGFYAQLRPNTASIIYGLGNYTFADDSWIRQRNTQMNGPLNIYEVHAGSFKRKPVKEKASAAEGPEQKAASAADAAPEVTELPTTWYNYRELAELLIPYLKENGYNYLELLPLSEHPSDESWGYQNTGFFSPTSRYGNPDDLRNLVDACHQNGIGVIMDFVPVHFAVDDYALAKYDGTCLYEYPNNDVGKSEWGSCNFMHSRGEVRSFLQSSAYYWLKEFHFDGLRFDAVSNLIYWQGNQSRGENLTAIQFLKHMNEGLKQRIPAAMLIAEDSTNYPGVTRPVWEGGLGFDYKWDLGWMNDTLSYFQSSPEQRVERYHKLTFSMMYFYNEKYLLPLSHDEVVHGKATITQKMNGEYEGKFPQARALYLYMMAHTGKKLNFMGNEIGQLREWDEKREQDWDILKYPVHDAFHRFMRKLNEIYLKTPALFGRDYEQDGFEWLDCHQEERCIYAFERSCQGQRVAAVFNFSDELQKEYYLPVKNVKKLTLLLSTDAQEYGGMGVYEKQEFAVEDDMVCMDLAPFSGVYLLME